MEGGSQVRVSIIVSVLPEAFDPIGLPLFLGAVMHCWGMTDLIQGGVMLEAERAAGMSTFRDNLEAEGEHGDEEKGKVGFNRVWYPG